MEAHLLGVIDQRLAMQQQLHQTELGTEMAVEGITEAVQDHWEAQFMALEERLVTQHHSNVKATENRLIALQDQLNNLQSSTEHQLTDLDARVLRMEQQGGATGVVAEAIERMQQEGQWAMDEAIRVRVEEEARQLQQLQQLRQQIGEKVASVGVRLEALEHGNSGQSSVKVLEQELKAAHQASLKALEAKGQRDYIAVEHRLGAYLEYHLCCCNCVVA